MRTGLRLLLVAGLCFVCVAGGVIGVVSYVQSTVNSAITHDDSRLAQAQHVLDQLRAENARNNAAGSEKVRVLACKFVIAEIDTAPPTTDVGRQKQANFMQIGRDPLLHCDIP
jgi:hypothetical protein